MNPVESSGEEGDIRAGSGGVLIAQQWGGQWATMHSEVHWVWAIFGPGTYGQMVGHGGQDWVAMWFDTW
jgi:hypothetical protein